MTTNINITQTWWRLLSAVGSTLITLVAWLGYMALCTVGKPLVMLSDLSLDVIKRKVHLIGFLASVHIACTLKCQ
jgi:hypothetical protein